MERPCAVRGGGTLPPAPASELTRRDKTRIWFVDFSNSILKKTTPFIIYHKKYIYTSWEILGENKV